MGAGQVCSPHTRGWTLRRLSRAPDVTLFPAHAGMDRIHTQSQHPSSAVPRTRGDGPAVTQSRGATSPLFPAHAGMDRIQPAER